ASWGLRLPDDVVLKVRHRQDRLRRESPPGGLGVLRPPDDVLSSSRGTGHRWPASGDRLRQESPPGGLGVLRPPDDILSLSRGAGHPWPALRTTSPPGGDFGGLESVTSGGFFYKRRLTVLKPVARPVRDRRRHG